MMKEKQTPLFTILSKELIEALESEIREDAQAEAGRILTMTNDQNRHDFLSHYLKGDGNICCLVLDYAKRNLVEQGLMVQQTNDAFGKFMDFDLDLNELKDKAAAFSDSKFGKDRTAILPLKKLREELVELEEALIKKEDPLGEYADCFLILIDSFRKYYGNDVDMQTLINACSMKLDVNDEREWKFNEEDGVFRHVK